MSDDINVYFGRFRDGDRVGFTRIYESLLVELTTFAYARIGSREDAQEIVVDTMLKLWKGRKGLETYAHAKNLCYRIVANACIDRLRKNARQRIREHEYDREQDREAALELVLGVSRWEEVMKLIKAEIPNLPLRQQQVFLLLCENKSAQEIAQELNIKISTVYKQRDAACEKIRHVLVKKGIDASMLIFLWAWWNI